MCLVVELVGQVDHDHGDARGAGHPDDTGQKRDERDHADCEATQTDVAEQVLVVGAVRADPVVPHPGEVGVEGGREDGLPGTDDQSEKGEPCQQQLDCETHADLR